jgi:integrase
MHLMAFRSTWEDLYESSTTRSKVQERLKAFFKDCADTYRLSHNPAKGLKAIKFNTPPTMPLSLDKEYPALLKATNEFRPPMCHRLHALVQLMRWSGLALQDACCFERSNLRRDANGVSLVKIRRAKTGVDVEVAIPPEVAAELEALPNSNPKYFFWAGAGKKSTVAGRYSAPMKRLFTKAGVELGGTAMKSHRLRDTFAVYYLEKNFSLEAVAEMLGHSNPQTTRKHYDHWVQGRQAALNNAVVASWAKAAG